MSDDNLDINEIDFDAQMRQLAGTDMQKLSQQAVGGGNGASPKGKTHLDKSELQLALGEVIRPVARELESLTKSASENNQLLVALAKKNTGQAAAASTSTAALDTIAQQMQRLGSVESANSKLFDALHAELKGYKDNFLFEALQKPFIRELLPFFDDLTSLHAQVEKRLDALRDREKKAVEPPPPQQVRKTRLIDLPGSLFSSHAAVPEAPVPRKEDDRGEVDFLKNLAGNVENHLHHLVEILLRMDVVLIQTTRGLPVDKKQHRTIAFEPAPAPEDDSTVARSVKPGFSWKERQIRAEDVVTYRWRTPGDAKPAETPAPQPLPPPVTTPSF